MQVLPDADALLQLFWFPICCLLVLKDISELLLHLNGAKAMYHWRCTPPSVFSAQSESSLIGCVYYTMPSSHCSVQRLFLESGAWKEKVTQINFNNLWKVLQQMETVTHLHCIWMCVGWGRSICLSSVSANYGKIRKGLKPFLNPLRFPWIENVDNTVAFQIYRT